MVIAYIRRNTYLSSDEDQRRMLFSAITFQLIVNQEKLLEWMADPIRGRESGAGKIGDFASFLSFFLPFTQLDDDETLRTRQQNWHRRRRRKIDQSYPSWSIAVEVLFCDVVAMVKHVLYRLDHWKQGRWGGTPEDGITCGDNTF